MQANPFDQFASDLGAAVPSAPPPQAPPQFAAPPPGGQPQFSMGGPPPPPQQQQQQQQQPGFYGGGPPPPPMGGMMGGAAPPPFGGAPADGMGLYAQPPSSDPEISFGSSQQQQPPPPPAAAPPSSDPFGGFGSTAPPPPPPPAAAPEAPQDNPFGAGPPPPQVAPSSSFGGPPAPYGGGPPPQVGPSSSFGGPPPPPGGMELGGQPPVGAPPGSVGGVGGDPWGAPQPPPQYGAPPSAGAIVPAETQNNPYATAIPPQPPGYPPQPQQPSPYGAPPQQPIIYGAPPPGAYPPPPQQQHPGGPPPPGPYGAPPPPQQYAGAMVPAAPPMDPFSVFEAQSAPPQQPQPDPNAGALVPSVGTALGAPTAQADDDFWGAFSSTTPAPAPQPAAAAPDGANMNGAAAGAGGGGAIVKSNVGSHSDQLPPGGEWYDAKIFTPTLGVMFFKPQELTDSLFLNTDRSIVDGLSERPVVAFIVEGSSARSAGVELGHVLLKVNGVDVKNPKEASRLIKEGPRPLPLLFYVPNTEVVVAEGEHMVKYDTRETTAPNSAKDWKPKYVVIGGIIAQPWMMNMYRSKSEYDIAVIETQARRPVSVKVKQFSLQGARIQNDWQGPQMVKYKNKLHPWKYIVVLPVARNPIKISSPNLASLKPVHEGIRRVLLAQQRDRGAKPRQQQQPQQQQHHGHDNGQAQQYGGRTTAGYNY